MFDPLPASRCIRGESSSAILGPKAILWWYLLSSVLSNHTPYSAVVMFTPIDWVLLVAAGAGVHAGWVRRVQRR